MWRVVRQLQRGLQGEQSWEPRRRIPGKALLFQLSRQEPGQAQAASGGLSLPDVAVPALCWCDTTELLLDSNFLWVALNSPVPPAARQMPGQSRICWHWWGQGSPVSSVGCSEGWQSPPAQAQRELSTTAWAGATEKKAISCLTRGLADEEGTEPLRTLIGSVVAERDAAPTEMWDTGLCTSKAHLDFTASPQNGAMASPSLPSLAGGTWEHDRAVAHWDNPPCARGGLALASPYSHPLPAWFPSRSV